MAFGDNNNEWVSAEKTEVLMISHPVISCLDVQTKLCKQDATVPKKEGNKIYA